VTPIREALYGYLDDALVRIGLLRVETRNDPNAIREALYGYLDQTLGRVRDM
jgi:hypothetical protein